MNVCFLHDGEPGQQGLQVILAGQVVVQRLRRITLQLYALYVCDCGPWTCMFYLTVMICALSSAERVKAFGFPLNSRWKDCMALAVTSFCKNKLIKLMSKLLLWL